VRLPVAAFQEVLKDYLDILIKLIQEVIHLQRIIFTALHQYFGLSSELIQNVSLNNSELEIKYKLDIQIMKFHWLIL